jgi:transposase-like protein
MTVRKRYTRAFQQDAVRLVSEPGDNHSEAARNLGLDRGMLGAGSRSWPPMRRMPSAGMASSPVRVRNGDAGARRIGA